MKANPFDRYPPIAELEQPAWDFDYGITLMEQGRQEEQTKRLLAFYGLAFLLFLALFVRLIFLQIGKGESLRLQALGNSIRQTEIPAPRGLIMDREGDPLVSNTAFFKLEIIPAYLPFSSYERRQILEKVTRITGIEIDLEKVDRMRYSPEPITLSDNVAYEQALIWQIQLANLPGVSISHEPRRQYVDIPGTAHLLGYIGKITEEELVSSKKRQDQHYNLRSMIGKDGLEVSFEEILRGIDGKTQLEVDAAGRKIRQLASISPTPGNNLHLFLNAKIQQVASDALVSSLAKVGSKAGTVIVVDPKTGGIFGLVSMPTFESAVFSGPGNEEKIKKIFSDPRHPLVNRAISGLYPPGSTIKPLWAAAALSEGKISLKTTIQSVGGFNIGQFVFKDWKSGGHGLTDVKKAIAESVNTFFYAVAGGYGHIPGLGIEKMKAYAGKFGINEETGIDLLGEARGFFPDPQWKQRTRGEGWFIGNTYQLGIGQGDVLVTPIGMLMAMTSLVNGGELLQPRLVEHVTDSEGREIKKLDKKIIRANFIPKEHLQTVKEGMRLAVTAGSARQLNDLPVEVAGKTGTAQYASRKKTHAWFFGFAPWQDPEIAVLVLVEGGGEGTIAAAPVAKEIFEAYFAR